MEKNEKIFEEARKKKINKRFTNSSIEYLKSLTKEIILSANHYIKILSTNFNNYFYSKLEKDIKNFLQKNKNNYIEIITSKTKNGLINELKKEFPKQIKVYYLEYNDFPIDNDTKEKINFIINDNDAYRYEYNDNMDYKITKSIANFNNKEETKLLNNTFQKLKQIAKKQNYSIK